MTHQDRTNSVTQFRWILCAIVCTATGANVDANSNANAAQPNIVFIFTDDMGYGDLGVLFQNDRAPGLPKQLTPHLDRMAAGGMQLRSHYCAAPVCAPSRASLLGGVHQGHCTVRNSQFGKALDDNHTLATVLKSAGYKTAMFGKHGLEGGKRGQSPDEWDAYPTKRGFDYFFGYVSATYDHDNDPNTSEVNWPEINQRYAGSVRRIDDCVGDLIDTLSELGIANNTLVVFSNDNGPHNVSYLTEKAKYSPQFLDNYGPFDGIKRNTWEGGIRMPALAYWPKTIPANSITTEPSASYDWLATFAEVAGVPAPAKTDGVSLLPTLTGSGTRRKSTIYVEFQGARTPRYSEFEENHWGHGGQMQVIQLDGRKGIRTSITSHADDFEIYDVINDPKEKTNLAMDPAYAELQQRMKDRVLQVRVPNSSAVRPYDSEYVPATKLQSMFSSGRVKYTTFEGDWPWLPDFQSMESGASGTTKGLNLSIRPRANDYGVLFSGYLTIPVDGEYTFCLTSDAGANLRIHDALVIDDDFQHDGSEVSGSIRLAAGWHPFRLSYRHKSGVETLSLKYSGSGKTKKDVPLSVFALPGEASTKK